MAYIDIPSELQHVNLAPLDVTDFGLATAGDVSNVVVILNVYNTATANTWDYEAHLINNGDVITSNYASNVFHSNTTTSERAFIFNANTFSKVEIESQSFGFRYRPRADGTSRVYVGNVRIRINNTAVPQTSYIQSRGLNSSTKTVTDNTKTVALIRSYIEGIQTVIAKQANRILNPTLKNVASLVKQARLTKSIVKGLQSTIDVLKLAGTQTYELTLSVIAGTQTALVKATDKILSITSNASTLLQKQIQLTKAATSNSIGQLSKNIQKNILAEINFIAEIARTNLLTLMLACSAGSISTVNKAIEKIINPSLSAISTIQKQINKILDAGIGLYSFIDKVFSGLTDILVPLARTALIKARDFIYAVAKRNSVEPVEKRNATEPVSIKKGKE
jgi:hypothetical protein